MRIGHGFDVHRFAEQAEESASIRLAGIDIPHPRRLLAHSDGDVALHAVCDAILGAAALGDIGRHFPDTDPRFANIDSRVLLRQVVGKVHALGFGVGNVDVTIAAQQPRLAPYIASMCQCLAHDLQVAIDQVNVKATTTEKLGFVGREEGIACHAVVLLMVGK